MQKIMLINGNQAFIIFKSFFVCLFVFFKTSLDKQEKHLEMVPIQDPGIDFSFLSNKFETPLYPVSQTRKDCA